MHIKSWKLPINLLASQQSACDIFIIVVFLLEMCVMKTDQSIICHSVDGLVQIRCKQETLNHIDEREIPWSHHGNHYWPLSASNFVEFSLILPPSTHLLVVQFRLPSLCLVLCGKYKHIFNSVFRKAFNVWGAMGCGGKEKKDNRS